MTARKQTKAARRENKLVKENATASNEPIALRHCVARLKTAARETSFTFNLDNNGDILMLIEIIFD